MVCVCGYTGAHFSLTPLYRYRNKERHGLSRTAPQIAAKAAADARLLAIQSGQAPEPSNEVGKERKGKMKECLHVLWSCAF